MFPKLPASPPPPPRPTWDLVQSFSHKADEALRSGNYRGALGACREGMIWIPALLRESDAEGSYMRPGVFPVLDHILRLAPVVLDDRSLEYIRVMSAAEKLDDYVAAVSKAISDMHRTRETYSAIAARPGVIQAEFAKVWDGAGSVMYMAAQLGLIERTKAGRSYALRMLVDLTASPFL